MGIYPAGQNQITSPTGAELVEVDGGGATIAYMTTAAIAALGSAGGTSTQITNTAITTAGAGVLTAAGLVGGLITRTGPVAAYTDTTATAALIVAALPEFVSGATFFIRIKNATSFTETIAAGTNVTLPATVIVGPWQEADYYGVIGGTVGTPTVTLVHIRTVAIGTALAVVSPAITALATNGAGTITAAMINGGFVNRTTVAAPFTDTTDTAANIIAGNPGLVGKIGASITVVYTNNATALATIAGGTGVTVSGVTAVPSGTAVEYVITYTAAATLTMAGVLAGDATTAATAFAGSTSGQTILKATAIAGATTQTLPAVTGVVASTTGANLFVADVYRTSAPVTKNANVTPGAVTGLSGAVAVGTYRFRASLPSTVASGTGGIAYQSLLTTAVLSAMECTARGYTASAVAVQHTTTATSAATLFTQAAVVIDVMLEGTFVVSTAGTFALTMCQDTSNASDTIALLGGYLELTRIA